MKIKLNPDKEVVDTVREGLKRTGGYCPCRRERTEATKCMCQEFKDQIADPNFEGFCHCMLSTSPCGTEADSRDVKKIKIKERSLYHGRT